MRKKRDARPSWHDAMSRFIDVTMRNEPVFSADFIGYRFHKVVLGQTEV